MAYAMTKQGSLTNFITYEFICDTVADMNAIETEYRTLGSVAIVLAGESGMEVYMAGSDKEWNSLTSLGGNAAPPGLTIYICGQNEVSNGLPDVEEPDETTLYLVPAQNETNNLYEEYVWVNDAWERFGGATLDLSGYATLQDIAGFYTKPNGGIPAADLAETYLTQHQDISNLATKSEIPNVSSFYTKPAGGIPATDLAETYLTQHQDISGKANISDLATVATSGSYNDLSNKPTIPTNVSDLNNDAGYLTQHQSLDAYATIAALNALTQRVAELETEISSLRNALNLLNVPENVVTGADGTPVTDEALNYVEFDEPTT